jgi:Sugar (and other) transporter
MSLRFRQTSECSFPPFLKKGSFSFVLILRIRGALGAIVIVACNLGLVVGYAVNSYLDYYTVPYIAVAILAVFFVGFPSVGAESPKYLIMKQNLDAAERSLKYFRGLSKTEQKLPKPLQEELQTLKNMVSASSDKPKLTLDDFSCKSAKKAIFIALFLNFLTIANGIEVIINYGEIVFLDAGSTLPPEVSTIIVGLILLVGSYISGILSDKAGRRILMGVSSTGCGLSLSILSGYSYLKANGYQNPALEWIPLACLSAFMLLGAIGILSLHLLIMSEVLSQKIRGVIFTICLVGNWFLAFISVKVGHS